LAGRGGGRRHGKRLRRLRLRLQRLRLWLWLRLRRWQRDGVGDGEIGRLVRVVRPPVDSPILSLVARKSDPGENFVVLLHGVG